MSLVFLVGMPGVGKTFWGRSWAQTSGYSFVDLDEHIEQSAGASIQDIFSLKGEAGFRALETESLCQVIALNGNTIVATGGGTPAFNDNMDRMLDAGLVVGLTASLETLIRQIRLSGIARPLLRDIFSIEEALQHLQRERASFYDRAHLKLAVENLTAGTFAQILQECTDRQL